ncbi:hypothetical protein B4166_1491 [Caldibacillus thermoamylovorans]|uniref:Uncharacterized protein n=1 Tax=Caldibacillus thermoamylovorans TaxID=35841 RepID=A0ABD4A993_9BACI|nr:hypothetical protein B4166_1491 [Caldibacillus thermoamylovorans]KIO73476.1 hypothetical protein B4167_2049 [Caldibacillus thermoamylovorans]
MSRSAFGYCPNDNEIFSNFSYFFVSTFCYNDIKQQLMNL